jgi:indolepyruvate ferredoxin oxidoreductase beta subunit
MSKPNPNRITNVVVAGLGGQGVLTASDILSEAVFRAGYDVKKSELHGMSQRGGSVNSDVRFGREVFSPMVPPGQADYLVVFTPDQVEVNRDARKPGGSLIAPDRLDGVKLPHPKSLNVALLGILSTHLPVAEEFWLEALRAHLPVKILDLNVRAFQLGRQLANSTP